MDPDSAAFEKLNQILQTGEAPWKFSSHYRLGVIKIWHADSAMVSIKRRSKEDTRLVIDLTERDQKDYEEMSTRQYHTKFLKGSLLAHALLKDTPSEAPVNLLRSAFPHKNFHIIPDRDWGDDEEDSERGALYLDELVMPKGVNLRLRVVAITGVGPSGLKHSYAPDFNLEIALGSKTERVMRLDRTVCLEAISNDEPILSSVFKNPSVFGLVQSDFKSVIAFIKLGAPSLFSAIEEGLIKDSLIREVQKEQKSVGHKKPSARI